MDRAGIRQMAAPLFDTADNTFISSIVDKVYGDLLGLCIPLTPSNVIMYLKVLFKEGDFHPFNRVDIVEKYLQDALTLPSEFYAEAFSAKEKMDIVSDFAYRLFNDQASYFSEEQWHKFSEQFREENLLSYSSKLMLSELENNRIIIRVQDRLYFRYSFFFSFLVGRHVAKRGSLLLDFLERDDRDSLDGIIEVISGLSGDNTALTERLVSDINEKLATFSSRYIKATFDPLLSAIWPDSDIEDEKLWAPVAAQIAAGPVSTQELDLIRTSSAAEARTQDQQVRYVALKNLEVTLFRTLRILSGALRAGSGVRGDLKKKAVDAILNTGLVMLQIGSIQAEKLAGADMYSWGGITFIGFKSKNSSPEDAMARIMEVITRLPVAVVNNCTNAIGSKKLGAVFKSLAKENSETGFVSVMIFGCLIASKPDGWAESSSKMIEQMGKNSYYLYSLLQILVSDYKQGVNILRDRDSLERLIAQVRAKRTLRKDAPGAKPVSRMLRHLSETNQIVPRDD